MPQVPKYALLGDFVPNGSSPCTMNYIRHMGYKPPKDKQTKKPSTGRDGMFSLMRQHPGDEVIPRIMKARTLQKADSGFSEEHVSKDQRMHPTFSFHPNTGRLSSRRPNLQNVPQDRSATGYKDLDDVKIEVANAIRSTIIAPEGFTLVEADWKAIEAVLVGFFAEDEAYIKAAKLGVHDILGSHVLSHQGVWKEPIDLSWPNEKIKALIGEYKKGFKGHRNQMKTIVHGVGYGRGVYAISKELRIPIKEAQLYFDIYHKMAPRVSKWQGRTRLRAHKEGFLENPFGYRRYFFDVLRPALDPQGNYQFDDHGDLIMVPEGDEADEALAFLPQSSAAGMMREALLMFDPLQDEDFWPVVSVHDSILFEVRTRMLDFWIAKIVEVMSAPVPALGGLTVEVEVKKGLAWNEMEEA